MSSFISRDDVSKTILSRLGLDGEPVKRIIVFLAARPNSSPWDHIQYDPDALVIRVWDPEDQRAVCAEVGMDAADLQLLLLDFEFRSLATYVARGLIRARHGDLAEALGAIAGSPLTSTFLPAGPLSKKGVNVPGHVIQGNRHIAYSTPPTARPYADLDEEPDNS